MSEAKSHLANKELYFYPCFTLNVKLNTLCILEIKAKTIDNGFIHYHFIDILKSSFRLQGIACHLGMILKR